MTVGELKNILDDYGDHLEVVVYAENGENERLLPLDVDDDRTLEGMPVIVFIPSWELDDGTAKSN